MSLTELQKKIENREAKLAVIGLGYVGLPVACSFAKAGLDVIGVDVFEERIETINAGKSPIEGNEPGLDELIREVAGNGQMRATTDYEQLRDRDVILIDVQTPVDENHKPHYEALRACLQSLGTVLKKDALVIVESTISPGTMNKMVLPVLEESSGSKLNEGFYLGNCPERVMPGKLLHNLKTLSRVVGGMTPETADTMVILYKLIVDGDLDPTDCTTAELVKTAENAYRDVQIAFANEVALVSEAVGGDVWKVRELVNKSPGRHMLMPGAGVGGHCIPKDPWLLADAVDGMDVPLRLIPAARAVNDAMPQHVADLLSEALEEAGKELKDAKVLVMGFAYLEDSDDTRNSPSQALLEILQRAGAKVVIHDPYVEDYKGDLLDAAQGCDAAVLMVKHQTYRSMDLAALKAALASPIMVDGRGFFGAGPARGMGFNYRGVGYLAPTQELQSEQ